ncbi:MAG: DUF255 domain-containing protein [Candidatus Eisenbacteria bacterium]|nr:DUF255 domain-containing protein [Candidatus Eisenbacteria bacterium]
MKDKNRLAGATSPYLLQHADNPVSWWPWCDEALDLARRENKPILVSIGYAACHWCHVMAHESFENPEIAAVMNDGFVCIKIDREERPDLDEIYLSAVQMMTGQGGWPLNVFLTPDLKPFFGGTYFPPDSRYGRPGWPEVLRAVRATYDEKREEVETAASRITEQLSRISRRAADADRALNAELIERGLTALRRSFDEAHGGFGAPPKFPRTMDLTLVMRRFAATKDEGLLKILTGTLDKMAAGGIYDQLGGGFHRYSTDERWLVPHFEKMLYDNALLARLYAEMYQVTGESRYAAVARETIEFVRREMTSPEGGFYSTLDADSEGEEGEYYVWRPEEIEAVLGPEDARLFGRMFDVDEAGHMEGKSIPHRVKSVAEMAAVAGESAEAMERKVAQWRTQLLEARSKRVRPGLDDKILTDWNGLMISACARAGRILNDPDVVAAGRRAAEFILEKLTKKSRLLHAYRKGQAAISGMLDDYAFLVAGLIDLWEATFDVRWLEEAQRLQRIQDGLFRDQESPGYFQAVDSSDLLVRMKSGHDASVPAGNAVAALNLLRLSRLTGRAEFDARAREILRAFAENMEQIPQAYSQMLIALDFALNPSQEVVVVGTLDSDTTHALAQVVWEKYLPNAVVAGIPVDASGNAAGPLAELPLGEGRRAVNGAAAVYVCENYACQKPATTPLELREVLGIATRLQ